MSRQLDPADVEAIAQRVVEILGDAPSSGQLVSAAELSRRLGLSRSTVYEKAEEFGAIRIGNGPRARLRFDAGLVAGTPGGDARRSQRRGHRAVPGRSPESPAAPRPPKPGLLPIRGEAPR